MSNTEALRAAAQQALEALEALQGGCTDSEDGTVEAITVWCPEVIDALRAALAQPAASGEPAAGWQLVPVEPTQEMCAAAVVFANGNAVYKNVAAEALKIEEAIYGEAYAAMLSAAPQPAPRVAQPLTDAQRFAMWKASDFRGSGGQVDWFIEGTRAAEKHHGITHPKEQP